MGDLRSARRGRIWIVGMLVIAMSACGADPAPAAQSPPLDAVELPAIGTPIGTATDQSSLTPETPALAEQEMLDEPAIWPAADVVFATPDEAAADFVAAVLISEGVPTLAGFQGDAVRGEIEVLFAGETGELDPPLVRGVLSLRRIGPTNGWYVTAATSDGAVIDTPSASEEVAAGPVTVSGQGRGAEGTLAVSAFPPGDGAATFDLQVGAGGAGADLEPYRVELDLSGAAAGEIVVILVHGDTGLGNDPSTFAAIPVVIASTPSVTIPPTE